jgi:hypothetical protein
MLALGAQSGAPVCAPCPASLQPAHGCRSGGLPPSALPSPGSYPSSSGPAHPGVISDTFLGVQPPSTSSPRHR